MPIKKHFDESKHKRGPKGSKMGGKFVAKGGGESATSLSESRVAARKAENGFGSEEQLMSKASWLDPNRKFKVVMKAWGGPNKLMQRRERQFKNHDAWVDFVKSGEYEIDQIIDVIQDA